MKMLGKREERRKKKEEKCHRPGYIIIRKGRVSHRTEIDRRCIDDDSREK